MEATVGRRWMALTYNSLIALISLSVIVQGFLFSGFYAKAKLGFIDAHGDLGSAIGLILIVILIPLAFLAKFPGRMRIGWWTVFLAVLWNVQAHVLGFGIEDTRWLAMIHIPVAFVILGLGLYLTLRTYGSLKGT